MVLLIIIPMKNGYFIGNINPTFSGPNPYENTWVNSPFPNCAVPQLLPATLFHIIATLQVSKPSRPSWSRWEGLCHFPWVFVCVCWSSSLKPRGLHCSPQSEKTGKTDGTKASVALPSHAPWYLMRSSLKPTAETNSGQIDTIGSWES